MDRKHTVGDGSVYSLQHTSSDEFRTPISRPVESKRRATRLWKDLTTSSQSHHRCYIRASLVSEETGSAFHPRGGGVITNTNTSTVIYIR